MLKAIEDKVIIIVDEEENVTSSGFFIASSGEKSNTGTVVTHGPGILLSDGDFVEVDLCVGDKVIFNKYAGTDIEHEGKSYLILAYRDILAVVG
jgi:chaperonin GroES